MSINCYPSGCGSSKALSPGIWAEDMKKNGTLHSLLLLPLLLLSSTGKSKVMALENQPPVRKHHTVCTVANSPALSLSLCCLPACLPASESHLGINPYTHIYCNWSSCFSKGVFSFKGVVQPPKMTFLLLIYWVHFSSLRFRTPFLYMLRTKIG